MLSTKFWFHFLFLPSSRLTGGINDACARACRCGIMQASMPSAERADFVAVGRRRLPTRPWVTRSAQVNTCTRAVTPRSPQHVVRVHTCKKADNNRRYRCAPRMFVRRHGVLHTAEMRKGERGGETKRRGQSWSFQRATARGERARARRAVGEASYVRAGGKEQPEEWIEDVRRPVHHLCRPTGIAAGVPV